MVGQTLLVLLLDVRPFRLEFRVVDVLQQALELGEVLEPVVLRTAKSFRDEFAETGVTLLGFVITSTR